MERPTATFCSRKYSVLNDSGYAEVLAYYTLDNKSSKTCEYQSDELDDNLIENNDEVFFMVFTKKNKLVISGEKMTCHKVRQIHRYHMPHRILSLEKFAYQVLL